MRNVQQQQRHSSLGADRREANASSSALQTSDSSSRALGRFASVPHVLPLCPSAKGAQSKPNCGKRVLKSLSTRTHVCDCGIPVLDRDYAASLNILKKATTGHVGSWSNEILDLNAWGDSTSILVGGNTCEGKLSH